MQRNFAPTVWRAAQLALVLALLAAGSSVLAAPESDTNSHWPSPPISRYRAPASRTGKIHPVLSSYMAAHPDQPASVIVHVRSRTAHAAAETRIDEAEETAEYVAVRKQSFVESAGELLAEIQAAKRAGRATDSSSLWIADAVALTADPGFVSQIADRADVRLVTLDEDTPLHPEYPRVEPQAAADRPRQPGWNLDVIRAKEVWNLLGFDGNGVTVAILDTGVDYHHRLLKPSFRGRLVDGLQLNGHWWCSPDDDLCGLDPRYPVDGNGHGTHVAGTVLGLEEVGVAPGAKWIAARVCPGSTCKDSWIVEAMQWLLAPAGRPELRPDVINGSFAKSSQNDLIFKESVDTLVEAGIVTVFAAGNNPDLVGAPGSYPSTITVGALTDEGTVWQLSGRGRSLWQEIKPEVIAPGVGITSTIAGGGLGTLSGTSMATPHVAGVTALLLDANPDLNPAEVKDILKRTANPLSASTPDPNSGWGVVNAFAAVASLTDVGYIRGEVLRYDGLTVPWAQVHLGEMGGAHLATADVDPQDGSYELAVRPGSYQVAATAFTFESQVMRGVEVEEGVETKLDFALAPVEDRGTYLGTVYGTVAGKRAPITATIRLAEAPRSFEIPVSQYTGFAQQLPPDLYHVKVEQFGYRVANDIVKIGPRETVTRTYELEAAPRILLVDGDAWLYGAASDYYRDSLDRLDYLYDEWRITNESNRAGEPGGAPTLADLSRYDLVIWVSPSSSPGFVGGASPMSAYLAQGGRLILAGQDALCTDAGTDVAEDPCNRRQARHPYVQDRLFVRVLRDNARSFEVRGAPGGPLEGITLTLNGDQSLGNQFAPDVLAVTNRLRADPIAEYDTGGVAGVLAGHCLSHRAVALGFGFEGIAGAATRDEVLARLIAAVSAPEPATGLRLATSDTSRIARAGTTADYTVTLLNTGAQASKFSILVENAEWPTRPWSPGFLAPLTESLHVGHCDESPFGIRVSIPEGTRRGAFDAARIRVRTVGGEAEKDLGLRTSTPAPVLVVDGDVFVNSEERYLEALDEMNVAYDVWEFGLGNASPERPEASFLAIYPSVVWFTGYDWRPTGSLSVESQRSLATYLEQGGRLYFASEDYLLFRGGTPYEEDQLFHEDYLGVDRYWLDEGRAHLDSLTGSPGSVLAGLPECRLPPRNASEDLSDRLMPSALARDAVLDGLSQPVGTQYANRGFKSLFLAFDAGQLNQQCATAIMGRALDWFSPLHGSTLGVLGDRRTFASGDELTLLAELANDGPRSDEEVVATWHLPAEAELLEAPGDWELDAQAGVLNWRGQMARGMKVSAEATLKLAELPDNSTVESELRVYDGQGLQLERSVALRVNAADLRGSQKTVPDSQRMLSRGETANFGIRVRNSGTRPAQAFVVTDTVPAGLKLLPQTLQATSGTWDFLPSPTRIVWRSSVEAGGLASLTYDARVDTHIGGWLHNRALLVDERGDAIELSASVFARPRLTFPWLARQVDPDP